MGTVRRMDIRFCESFYLKRFDFMKHWIFTIDIEILLKKTLTVSWQKIKQRMPGDFYKPELIICH